MNKLTIPKRPPLPEPDVITLLTDREFEILCLIAQGAFVKQIADRLNIGVQTVHTYRYRVMDKIERAGLTARNDVKLTLFALKNGIIDLEDVEL